MIVDVIMPKMGESITEGTILEWYKQVGQTIDKDETLLEIGTDKVDSEIPAPDSGIIVEILAKPNDVIDVGEIIAKIETEGSSVKLNLDSDKEEKAVKEEELKKEHKEDLSKEDLKSEKITKAIKMESGSNNAIITPAVATLASQEGIALNELSQVVGTGKNGRITKKDLEVYIASNIKAGLGEINESSKEVIHNPVKFPDGEKVKIDNMRKRISEHMRHSLETSAHVHIMNDADMTSVVNFVKKEEDLFLSKEGFNLTYTPFIIHSIIKALKEMPEMNSSFDGELITKHENINIGIAVSVDGGLMVPCIKKCDEKNLLGICRELNAIVQKTRTKTIGPDDLQGSTFTLSNFGIFGATIGTPIINQPNVGILGTGEIKKQPIVIEKNDTDAIAIRQMMALSLGFDHRLIDGAGGAKFLLEIKNNLENLSFESLL